jgi:mono/diheme cytochrome c family protein
MRSDLVKGVLATTLGLGLVAGLVLARPAIAQDSLPDGPGKAETLAACSGCHGIGQILGEHRAADMWATTVTSMINNGAPVADADFDKVVGYLATNFGPEGQAPAAAAPAGAAPAAPASAAPAAPATAAPAGNFPPAAAGATPVPPATPAQ